MQIHYAAKRGDRDAVLRHLAHGIAVDAWDEGESETPLMWAIGSSKADTDFLDFLIKQGADVNAVSGNLETTPLMKAARSGDAAKVRFLIDAGADVRFRNANGYTALISGTPALPAVTEILLDAGAEPNGETPWKESALSVASRESDWVTVRLLLDAGADPAPLQWTPLMHAAVFGSLEDVASQELSPQTLTAQDRWERTPWLHAVCAGDIPKARLLLERGSDVHAHGRGGQTALMYAAMCDDAPMTHWLLALGVDVNEASPFGDTALHTAAEYGAVQVIALLLAAGANVQAENEVQTQPIDNSADIETVRLLAAAGADINFVNGQGYWLLKSAAESGNLELVRDLLALGASVDTTSSGETALHAAVREDEREIIRLLLAAGADPNAQDVDGWGVLWYVRTAEAAEILLAAGANIHLTDDMGQEAIAHHTDTEIQERLITAGCYLNPPETAYGAPLLKAVERSVASQVRFLLSAGADVNAASGWGQTALMEASENSFTEGVQLLLSVGADVQAQDEGGRTALHHASVPEAFTAYTLAQETASTDWRASLIDSLPIDSIPEEVRGQFAESLDIGQYGYLGQYGYVESDSVECLGLLVAAGADINAPDAAGLTPLMLAASCGRASRVASLLALGADVSLRSPDGRTAWDFAEAHPRADQRDLILPMLPHSDGQKPIR